jgi:hypothetical protein
MFHLSNLVFTVRTNLRGPGRTNIPDGQTFQSLINNISLPKIVGEKKFSNIVETNAMFKSWHSGNVRNHTEIDSQVKLPL